MDSFDYDKCYRDIEEAKRRREAEAEAAAQRRAYLDAVTAERDALKAQASDENAARLKLEIGLSGAKRENERLRDKVHELEHIIQHWEVDCDGLKDDLAELREAAEVAADMLDDYSPAPRGKHSAELRAVLAKVKP